MNGAKPTSTYRVLPGLRAVVSGVGCVAERLAAELALLRVERPLVVCGEQVARGPTLAAVRAALGRPAVVFSGSRPHTPQESVDAGAASARANDCDAVVAVGGGAAVDCAKGIAVLVSTGVERVAQLEPLSFRDLFARESTAPSRFPLIAVTTTLSFAEFLPFWGARHRGARRKRPYSDQGRVERTIFLDGALAAQTPDQAWLETGVKALDDAISTWCRATGPEPFLDPLLGRAIADLVEWLPRSKAATAEGADPDVRQRVLIACWMTKTLLPTLTPPGVEAWLSTAVRHALGAVCEARHGAASCVALPEALRFHADATRARQHALAAAIGWPTDGAVPLSRGLEAWLDALEAPRRLSTLGIGAEAIDGIVEAVLEEAPRLGDERAIRAALDRMR
jgi:maleylacetate reductase